MIFVFHSQEKDMGLRDHAGLCLKRICPAMCTKFADKPNELNFFLNIVLLPLIKEGIESKLENYQYESILLLGHMVSSAAYTYYREIYNLPATYCHFFFLFLGSRMQFGAFRVQKFISTL